MPNNEPRISFESETTEERLEPNQGLKMQSSRSRVNRTTRKEAFERQVKATHKRLEGHLLRAYNLGKRFNEIIADTRLSENIGPDTKSLEKENIRGLINYAIEVNSDEQEREGMGSVSLITLLFNTLLKQRDRMNTLSYANHLLEKRISDLENSNSSSSQKAGNEDKQS